MAHQLVGYLDAPVSLTALAGSTWPLRPHMDTGAESTQYSSRLVHIAGGGGAGRGATRRRDFGLIRGWDLVLKNV